MKEPSLVSLKKSAAGLGVKIEIGKIKTA